MQCKLGGSRPPTVQPWLRLHFQVWGQALPGPESQPCWVVRQAIQEPWEATRSWTVPPQSLLALQWPKQRASQSLTHLQKQRQASADSLSSLTSLWRHPTTLSADKSMLREVNQEGGVHQVRSHPWEISPLSLFRNNPQNSPSGASLKQKLQASFSINESNWRTFHTRATS